MSSTEPDHPGVGAGDDDLDDAAPDETGRDHVAVNDTEARYGDDESPA